MRLPFGLLFRLHTGATGEFLDTGAPTSSDLDGGGLDGTMGGSSGFQSSPFYAPRFDDPKYTQGSANYQSAARRTWILGRKSETE